MDKLIKSPSRSFSVRVQNYLEACRVCMTLPPKKKSRTEQFWSICSVKAAGADLFLIDALAYISGKDIDKNEKLYPQTICPKCVIDINTILKPLQDLKTTIERTELSWKAFKKERLKHDQGDSTGASYEITEYVVEEEEEDAELAEEEPEAMDAVAFLLKNMTKDGGEHKGSNADDDESEDDLGMSIEQEAQSEETILPNNQTTVFTIIDYPTQRVIKTENNDQPAAPESPPPERKPYERRPKPNEATISYEDRKHVCEVCQKRFLKKSNLIDHLRLHANMKIFKCDFCDRSFVQMGNYKQHLRTHTEEKPFTCKFCNKSYTQSSALKIHIRTHTDITALDACTPLNTLEFRVYEDLWRRGKFLTTGETFGGHFLVYPGDPIHFHASHIVHVVHAPLTVTQLVSYGRVSVIVNKACVFASESASGDIVYQHMEWENDKDDMGV